MEEIKKIMEFNRSILLNGILGEFPTHAEFEEAMEAAKALNELRVFKFDLEDEVSFMKSVEKFANSFR